MKDRQILTGSVEGQAIRPTRSSVQCLRCLVLTPHCPVSSAHGEITSAWHPPGDELSRLLAVDTSSKRTEFRLRN